MEPQHDTDVIIPVHTATRPIARAVASVVNHTQARIRVTVVAHNIDPEVIRANLGEYVFRPDVRVVALADGIPSPAGPMNHALDLATARYFTLMGSDDELEPGAIDSWLAIARETSATTVLARIERQLSGSDPFPPVRVGRTRELDAVKDRLAYRCAPLGLVSRDRFAGLRFTPGLHSGEDLEFTAALWFTGEHIAYDRMGPAYVVHEDEGDRVTYATRSVEEDFAFLDAIEAAPWFANLTRAQRKALAVKTIRLHYFDAVLMRLNGPNGIDPHRLALERVITRLNAIAPGTTSLLSRADDRVISAVRNPDATPEQILRALEGRWSGAPQVALVPRNPFLAFHRQAPYATMRAMIAP